MPSLPLVILLTLAAGPNRPIPEGCREDQRTCREDCTIEYGGSTTKYRQLIECTMRCDKEQKECSNEYYLRQEANFEMAPRTADPALREPDTIPASGTEPARDSVRQGVYRASEAEPPTPTESSEPVEAPAAVEPPAPAKKPEPIAAPAPKSQPAAPAKPASKDSEDIPIFDDPEPEPAPAPKPAPKPVEPTRPQPPPEPKKKDISDWDPNGD